MANGREAAHAGTSPWRSTTTSTNNVAGSATTKDSTGCCALVIGDPNAMDVGAPGWGAGGVSHVRVSRFQWLSMPSTATSSPKELLTNFCAAERKSCSVG